VNERAAVRASYRLNNSHIRIKFGNQNDAARVYATSTEVQEGEGGGS
jgi:hypothetical protein